MNTRVRCWLVLACLPVGVLAGCAGPSNGGGTTSPVPPPVATEVAPPGDIPDNQAFVAYRSTALGYEVQVPEGWARTQSGTATVFTDKYNSIKLEVRRSATAPTVASAKATEIPVIQGAVTGFVAGSVTAVDRTSGAAIEIVYRADSAPDPVTGKVIVQAVERYEFWRAGTEAVITLSSSPGSDNVDPWRKVTDSFRWTS